MTEKRINKLVQSISAKQEQLNIFTMETIASTVNSKAIKEREDLKAIDKKFGDYLEIELALIIALLNSIAISDYAKAEKIYSDSNVPYVKFDKNKKVKDAVDKVIDKSTDNVRKMLSNPKFVIRDLKHPQVLKPLSIAETYKSVVSEASQPNVNMTRTLSQLADSGLREVIIDDNGRRYSRRLDISIEQDLLDDIKDVRQTIQNVVKKQTNADGIEISVHANSAPDHEPVQGHQFTNEEFDKMQNGEDFTDVDGVSYAGFERAIGEWNCRHITWSIIVGSTPQTYSNEELEKIKNKNQKGYTLPDGKHLSLYECSQRQRAYERKIKMLKEGQIVAKAAGDIELAKRYQSRINNTMDKYINFSRACNLAVYSERTNVDGYRPLKF